MSWRYKLNACDTRLMRETWHHSNREEYICENKIIERVRSLTKI